MNQMMRLLKRISTSILLCMLTLDVFGQSYGVGIDNDRKFWLGINIGGLWQNSDVRSRLGGASGLTFDYFFIRNSTSVFGLGIRGQYLAAISTGQDIIRDYGIQNNPSLNGFSGSPDYASLSSPDNYVFQNHSTEISDLSGNLVISLNRLRATTGIHLYLFGGLGGTGYLTSLDQRDGSGNLYNYNVINPDDQKSKIREDLNNLRDGTFETSAGSGSKEWVLTPTVGAGFGIQLSPRIQIGFEHKVGFTGTDLLDGNQWDPSGKLSASNDIYHYSAINVNIGIGKLTGGGGNVQSEVIPDIAPPVITVLEPSSSLYTSPTCNADIRARITNIQGKQDITLKRGLEFMNPADYSWNQGSGILEIHEPLNSSTVTYSISTSNSGGSASRIVIINCLSDQVEETIMSPPKIEITNPTTRNYETSDCSAQILARITNVSSQEQLDVKENGRSLSTAEYSWNPKTRTLRISKEVLASSRFVIIARNQAGTDIQETRITCINNVNLVSELKPPVLNVLTPRSHPYATPDCIAKMSLRVENVTEKDQITIIENGQKLSPVLYSFNSQTGLITLSRGLPGETEYYIKAENDAGSSSVTQSFVCPQSIQQVFITICHSASSDRSNPQTISIPTIEWPKHMAHGDTQGTCPVVEEPGIIVNNPSSSSVVVEDCKASINATVLNIEYREDVEVLQNGKSIPFNFSGNTVSINNVPFEGSSTFTIMVTNLQGTVTRSVTFVCQPRPVRMITVCHSEEGNAPRTISIPASEWEVHRAHGDTQGDCPVIERPMVTILSPRTSPVTLNNCVASLKSSVKNVVNKTDITVTKAGMPVPFQFSENIVTVSDIPFVNTATFVITAKNSSGSSVKKVSFICEPEIEMITICHSEPGMSPQTISIPASGWDEHSSHGDIQGVCPVIEMPRVTILSPQSSPITLENCQANIRARVENVSGKQNIIVTANGSPIDYEFEGGILTLKDFEFNGSSNFLITASNSAGSSNKSVAFICKPPVEMITICHKLSGTESQTISIPATQWAEHSSHGDVRGTCPVEIIPVVTILSPGSLSVTVGDCKASVSASVMNISGKENISVTHNGNPIDFNFTANTVSIKEMAFSGTANISITAENSAGSSIQTITFICQPQVQMIAICHNEAGGEPRTINIPETDWTVHASHGDTRGQCPVIEKPVVSITSPLSSTVTLEVCVATIRATVENVADKGGITVTGNGSSIPFEFSGNMVTVSNIPFDGNIEFRITGTNSKGTSTSAVTFICQPAVEMITICHSPSGSNPETITIPVSDWPSHESHGDSRGECISIEIPEVHIISPQNSPVTVENCVASLQAIVENISGRGDISVTINDLPVDFTFTGNTISVADISFTGSAEFLISARNQSGIASQSVTFICQPEERKIAICHYPPGNADNPQSINIAESAWPAHEAHGDSLGECPVIELPVIVINNPGPTAVVTDCKASINATLRNVDNKSNIEVTQDGASVLFDYSGNSVRVSNIEFSGTSIFRITARNSAGSVSESVEFICQQNEEEEEQDTDNKETKITICHYPPGNKNNPQTISIPESAWPAHEKHGDSRGPCNN